jgi:hypothetical protein
MALINNAHSIKIYTQLFSLLLIEFLLIKVLSFGEDLGEVYAA